jgi:L-fuculose-phosphate aldolase
MIAVGATLVDALALAVEVEALAEQFWRALQIGEPNLLTDAEMDVVLAKFASYGQLQSRGRAARGRKSEPKR